MSQSRYIKRKDTPRLQVYPCALSVTVYHFFQLTELSTMFLHVSWMAWKANATAKILKMLATVLISTFTLRVLTSAYILAHVIWSLKDLQLTEV